MKRSFTVIIAMLGIYLIFVANASGPPIGSTGAPGENTCKDNGGACHVNSCNLTKESPKIDILLNGMNATTFKFDSTYDVSITIDSSKSLINGFQAVVKNAAQDKKGTFFSGVKIGTSGGYIYHNDATIAFPMKFKWKAPSKDTSAMKLTIYVATNEAFKDGSVNRDQSHDSIRTKSLALTADTTKSPGVGIFNTSLAKFSVHPTLVSQFVTISSDMMNMNYEVFNTSGIQVIKGNIENNIIDVAKLNKGLYYIVVDQKIAKFMKD